MIERGKVSNIICSGYVTRKSVVRLVTTVCKLCVWDAMLTLVALRRVAT